VPSSPQSSVGTAGGILLVEEYEALAIALRSALRKLTPEFEARVVHSLAAAEVAIAAKKPDLLVLDFDPPHPHALAFFSRLQSTAPSARVLVIGAGTSLELSAEQYGPAAIHFLEKPFDLVELAAAVRGLIAPWTKHGFRETRRTVRDLNLADMIALHGIGGVTMVLEVEASRGRRGQIHLSGGQIRHAVVMGKAGQEALQEMLPWRSPRFAEAESPVEATQTIHGRWSTVLLEALRAIGDGGEVSQPERPIPAALSPPGKTIVVIDDTEMLLILVEEVLSTADPTLKIVTAPSGEAGLGCIQSSMPDLVLLDYSLPDVTGDEICRRLIGNETTARIPVIMMSGHVAEMMATAQRFSNVVATIGKPFLSTALIDLVSNTLTKLESLDPPPQMPQSERLSELATAVPSPSAEVAPKQEEKTAPPPEKKAEIPFPRRKRGHNGKSAPAVPAPIPSIAAPTANLPTASPSPDVEPAHAVEKDPNLLEAPTASAGPLAPASTTPLAQSVVAEEAPAVVSTSRQRTTFRSSAPAAWASVQGAQKNPVILSLPLEIASIQFSASLRMIALRARPTALRVSLQLLPQPVQIQSPETRFDLAQVDLDSRGQIDLVRLAPAIENTIQENPRRSAQSSLDVADLALLPLEGGEVLLMTPTALAPMRMHLRALFDLLAIEFSDGFGIGHVVLRARGGKMRASLDPGTSNTGVTFETAQVLLDRSGRIAELLLDTVA